MRKAIWKRIIYKMVTEPIGNHNYLQLMQQVVELQRENNELDKERVGGGFNTSHMKKPEWPVRESDATDGD